MVSRPPPSASAAPSLPDAIWSRYRSNTARHLMGIARDLEDRMMRSLTEEAGYSALRPSFGPVLALVAVKPRALGALAAALSISPQACSQLVTACVSAGYAERLPDPHDGRTRVVALTERGKRLVDDAMRRLHRLTAEYAERIGNDEMAAFEDALGRLAAALTRPEESASPPAHGAAVGVLPLVSVDAQQKLMRATSARGHDGLKMSHAQVLPLIGPEGARVSALARVQRISRQAISATARELEDLGYLRRDADPRDRRGVVFRLTPAGERLITDSVSALDELDAQYGEAIGVRRFAALRRGALALYESLGLEREIFDTTPAAGESLERLADRLQRELGREEAIRLADLLGRSSSIPTAAHAATSRA